MLQQTTITVSTRCVRARGKYIQVPTLEIYSDIFKYIQVFHFEKINANGDHVRLNLRCAWANEDLEMTVLYTQYNAENNVK